MAEKHAGARAGRDYPIWRINKNRDKSVAQAEELVSLIRRRLAAEGLATPEREQFVDSRFKDRMITHLVQAPKFMVWFHVLSVVAIVGATAVSGLGGEVGWLVTLLGVVIALATAINQAGRLGQRSAVRFTAGNALRKEGWDYVMGRGRYLNKEGAPAFALFYDAVWEIERPADAIVEAEPEQVTGARDEP